MKRRERVLPRRSLAAKETPVILPSTLRCRDHDDAPVGRPKGRRDGPERNRLTSVEYDGDNPLRLAEEIDAALDKYGLATITHVHAHQIL